MLNGIIFIFLDPNHVIGAVRSKFLKNFWKMKDVVDDLLIMDNVGRLHVLLRLLVEHLEFHVVRLHVLNLQHIKTYQSVSCDSYYDSFEKYDLL